MMRARRTALRLINGTRQPHGVSAVSVERHVYYKLAGGRLSVAELEVATYESLMGLDNNLATAI